MSRLLIHVEGETEEKFVNGILGPHLYHRGYSNVSARLIGNSRQRDHRGGIKAWSVARKEIINHLRENPACLATTMVDYYALPQSDGKAWPGRKAANILPFAQKTAAIENALLADICHEIGDGFDSHHFIPFVIMHEFEGLLFSDCQGFGRGIGRPELAAKFQLIRDQFLSPEEINDSPKTAPSKRVEELFPGYEKPLLGVLAILEIGITAIRDECPHFHEWLIRLEDWHK